MNKFTPTPIQKALTEMFATQYELSHILKKYEGTQEDAMALRNSEPFRKFVESVAEYGADGTPIYRVLKIAMPELP